MMSTALSHQDSFKLNTKKTDMDAILPFFILPTLFLIATISRTVTIIIMVVISMGVLYVYSRPRQKNRSPFFFSWTLSSCLTMLVVFEIKILGLLEITLLENITFLILLAYTGFFFYKMKTIADFELACGSSKGKEYSPVLTSDSYYCHICEIEVNERFFHSIWWGCCILKANYVYFFLGQIFASATLIFGTNLGLTSVCQPALIYGSLLMPEDCEGVYRDFDLAISFVACVYGMGYLSVVIIVLVRQLCIYVPKYVRYQWKRSANERNV